MSVTAERLTLLLSVIPSLVFLYLMLAVFLLIWIIIVYVNDGMAVKIIYVLENLPKFCLKALYKALKFDL